MHLIKNYDSLAINDNRKLVLDLIETAFASLNPHEIFRTDILFTKEKLTIQGRPFDLTQFDRLFVVGFGKGSAGITKILEERLGKRLTEGYVIDVVKDQFSKIKDTVGTHPYPSQENFDFAEEVITKISHLSERDLVFIVTCGGGSALFEKPHKLSLDQMIAVNKALLASGATISEINVIRKHLSKIKGGGFAKSLYPATVINLIFSDVPGNDLSVIASAPLVKDPTTINDAKRIYEKYKLDNILSPADFVETPKEEKYFQNVHNILMLSNLTALAAMEQQAAKKGLKTVKLTDRLQGDARETGKYLLKQAELMVKKRTGQILLAGGETTIKVTGKGKGGRNQALVLAALHYLEQQSSFWQAKNERVQNLSSDSGVVAPAPPQNYTVLAAFSTDGWDFYGFAGAIADKETLKQVKQKHLDINEFLNDDNSYEFWGEIGGGIDTGKQESNVSDLFIVLKKN